MYRALFAALCLFLFPPSALGQSAPPDASSDTTVVALPPVTVEASRATETAASAPFAVSTVARSRNAQTLEAPVFLSDALQDLPGVWMNDRGHFALGERLVVRGMGWRSPFGVRGVQVQLDGIPLTMPDGQAFLDIVDPLFVRSAEAVRGPSSLFWGNGSGGVLFLDTQPRADTPTATLRAGGGSYGLQQLAAEGVARTERSTWRAAVSDMRRDGFRANSDGRFTRALLSSRHTLGPRTRLNVVGALVDQDARNPGSLTASEVEADRTQANTAFDAFDAGKQTTQAHLGTRLRHAFATTTLQATAFGGFRNLENPLPFSFIAFDRVYGGLRTTLSGTAGSAEWNVGADAMVQRDDRINRATDFAAREFLDEVTLDQIETVRSTSAFGYVRIPLADRLRLTLGSRLDAINFSLDDNLQPGGVDNSGDRTFAAVSPGIGVAYDAGAALLFANYNTAFETPTTTELVNRPGMPGGFNPDLEPQRTRGLEVGTRGAWDAARLQFDLALYQLWVDDRLVSFEIPDSGGRAYFQNVGANTHRGLELAVQWDARPWLDLETSYTANRIVFDNDDAIDGNRVPGVPDQRFVAHATASVSPVWLRLSWTAVSDYWADNANTARVDGYALTNAHVGLTDTALGGATIRPYVAVNNVFDVAYIGSVSINANDNFYEPGVGRTLRAGVTVTL